MDDGPSALEPSAGRGPAHGATPPLAVEVRGLTKSYGGTAVLRGVDFAIAPGEIFALLGPNGAGKTTAVEILEGFRRRDGGSVRVLGEDPADESLALRSRIGVVLQANGVDPYLSVAETLAMFASIYPHPRPVDEVIDLVGLGAQRDARVVRLSGGQQRRLDVAVALVGDPELLFLDEPTTGFDPSARREAWEVIKNLAALGKTVLLTTHYMDEAQYLADAVAVIAQGRIVARGTPATIGNRSRRRARVRFSVADGASPPARLAGTGGPGEYAFDTEDATADLHELTTWALEGGHPLEGLEVTRPTLEDVYLELTEAAPAGAPAPSAPVGRASTPVAEPRRRRERAGLARLARVTFTQARYVNKAFWRNPSRAFFTFAFPLMFLVIFSSLVGNFDVPVGNHVVKSATYYVASMGAYAVINACWNSLAIALAFQREEGLLKRVRGTPMPSSAFLVSRVLHSVAVGVGLVVVTAAFGRAFYGVSLPTGLTLARFLMALVVGAAAFCALGLATVSFLPNTDSAIVTTNAIVLPLLFLSGVFIPITAKSPSWIQWVARVFPVRHFVNAMQTAFLGAPFSWSDVGVIALWGAAALVVALRLFTWEPRRV